MSEPRESEPVGTDSPARPTQLAAIVFTDIAGYSRLMEEDEERTIRLLREHNAIVLPLVEQSGGEVIDAIGDGLFILFASARDALRCALEVQHALARRNETAAASERFLLRVGVHIGEVWRDEGRVYGSGVNLAARVQPLAQPGGICITEDAMRLVEKRIDCEFVSIGRHELRNISRRIEIYRVVTGSEEPDATRAATTVATESTTPPDTTSEFDAIKQRILRERERRSENLQSSAGRDDTRAADGTTSLEDRIESKVFSIVERVMESAIDTWDSKPPKHTVRAVPDNVDDNVSPPRRPGSEVRITATSHDASAHEKSKKNDEAGEVASRIATGIVAGTGFGLGTFLFGIGWMIWPFAIIGVLPFVSGVLKWVRRSASIRRSRRDRPRELEQTILRFAGVAGGRVTVVQTASSTGVPLDEIQESLDRMTAKGYVTQHVRDSGIVEYEFPSLANTESQIGDR